MSTLFGRIIRPAIEREPATVISMRDRKRDLEQARKVVFVRIGGKLRCEWKRIPGAFTPQMAAYRVEELAGSQLKAVMHDLEAHKRQNLCPIGWESSMVDHDRDFVALDENGSRWVSHRIRKAASFSQGLFLTMAEPDEFEWFRQEESTHWQEIEDDGR